MNTEKKLIPLLRFPEFVRNTEWICTTLKAEMDYENGVAHENDIDTFGKYIVVNSKFISTEGQIEKRTNSARCLAKEKDILMVLSDLPNGKAIAKCFYVDASNKYTVNQRICKLRSKGANSKLLYYIINRNPYFLSFDDGVKQTNLKKEEVLNCPLILPKSIEEQSVIAECLFSIDSYISFINEKVEQLKAHKKGLLQKLFPQRGKTVPEYRFTEFKGSKGWEEKRLGDIFKRITNKNVTNNKNVLTISAQYGLVSQYDFFHKNVAASNLSNYFLLKKGDFAYNKSRSQGYPYGAIKPLRLYDEGVVSTLYICFRIKCCDIVDSFFEHYFETELINEEIGQIAQEGARNHGLLNVSTDDFFNKVVLLIPPPSEQKKIAECLSSIDRTIKLYSEKASLLEQHKKGIMQQLFPQL